MWNITHSFWYTFYEFGQMHSCITPPQIYFQANFPDIHIQGRLQELINPTLIEYIVTTVSTNENQQLEY